LSTNDVQAQGPYWVAELRQVHFNAFEKSIVKPVRA